MNFLDLLEKNAYALWMASLHGCDTPSRKELYNKLSNPDVGHLVLEVTSKYSKAHDGKRLGRLKKVAIEEYPLSEEAKMDYDRYGQEYPTEKVYYIELPDGTEMRWVNASFVRVLEE